MARSRRTGRTLEGTFEARESEVPCRLVVTLADRGLLHGYLAFGSVRLWLRGAHANRGRVAVGALSTTHDGLPLAWVRLRALEDTVQLDLDPTEGPAGDPKATPSIVIFGRSSGER